MLKQYIINILVSIDQFGNVLIGGDPDETISSRAGKDRNKYWYWNVIATILDWIVPNHVENAEELDEGKNAVVPD